MSLTVAVSVVASGGEDDTIHLYDLSAASSLGSLHHHSVTVTALSFYTPPNLPFPRNLISADAAGSVSIVDADGFVHRNVAINDLALHPSGERALTVARDNCLAVVNLVRGRRNCCLLLDKEATLVKFDVSGDRFFMAAKEKVSVHQTEDARILFDLECSKPVLCAAPARVRACSNSFSVFLLSIRVVDSLNIMFASLVIFILCVSSLCAADFSFLLMMHYVYLLRRRRNILSDGEFIVIDYDEKLERKKLVLALPDGVNSYLLEEYWLH
ncbi:unnamed protein product, partial [Sphenostylis stenocarpa]